MQIDSFEFTAGLSPFWSVIILFCKLTHLKTQLFFLILVRDLGLIEVAMPASVVSEVSAVSVGSGSPSQASSSSCPWADSQFHDFYWITNFSTNATVAIRFLLVYLVKKYCLVDNGLVDKSQN